MKDNEKQTYIILAFIAIVLFFYFKKQKEKEPSDNNNSKKPGTGGGGWGGGSGADGDDTGGNDDNGDDDEGGDDDGDDPENPNIIVGGLIYQPHNDPLTLNPYDLQQYEETNMELLPTRNNEEAKLPMEILPDERFEDLVQQKLLRFNQSLKISRRETIHFVSKI